LLRKPDCDEEIREAARRGAGTAGPGVGLSLTGPDRLLKQLTKQVLENGAELGDDEHLGHEKLYLP
jgi:hypothetical protein